MQVAPLHPSMHSPSEELEQGHSPALEVFRNLALPAILPPNLEATATMELELHLEELIMLD